MDIEHDIIEIAAKIDKLFLKVHWMEVGQKTMSYDLVNNHKSLLPSLDEHGELYRKSIHQVLSKIRKRDLNNIRLIKEYLIYTFYSEEIIDNAFIKKKPSLTNDLENTARVFNIPQKEINNKLVAVMFPFNLPNTHLAIKNACYGLDLDCKMANDVWEHSTFIQDIVDLIYTSRVVVADFSGKNPNVFYEVGIAHAFGKIVVPISQSLNDIPSDLRHHRVLIYLPNEQGYKELTHDLSRRLRTLIPVVPGS